TPPLGGRGARVRPPAPPPRPAPPRAPRCAPSRAGRQEDPPAYAAPPAPTPVAEAAVVVRRAGRVLLAQRPAAAVRWAGLWEFPHGELAGGETHEEAARRLLAGGARVGGPRRGAAAARPRRGPPLPDPPRL